MDYLNKMESESIFIIREAFHKFKHPAVLWSVGKDSTTLMWLIRKAFFGKIPFPVIHIDTGYKFKEIYEFRDEYAKKWQMNLIVIKNEAARAQGVGPNEVSKFDCCNLLKTEALKSGIKEHGFDALFLGIRRDEHGIRAKERVFSHRSEAATWNYSDQSAEIWDQYRTEIDQTDHVRVHPILQMTECDIWRYIRRQSLPVCSLYFANAGKRFRSIGCETCCEPVTSKADTVDSIIRELEASNTSERAGRSQDKEDIYTMQKLRSLGYM